MSKAELDLFQDPYLQDEKCDSIGYSRLVQMADGML